jgi:hypothetical protein
VYPNLAASLGGQHDQQLWLADLTYIRLREEFIYRGMGNLSLR